MSEQLIFLILIQIETNFTVYSRSNKHGINWILPKSNSISFNLLKGLVYFNFVTTTGNNQKEL